MSLTYDALVSSHWICLAILLSRKPERRSSIQSCTVEISTEMTWII